MSFRCQGCNEAQPVYSCPTRVVLKTKPGPKFGTQIAREANYCGPCAERHELRVKTVEKAMEATSRGTTLEVAMKMVAAVLFD